ncbi:MAG: ABC transporter ATP-binding protein [Bacteroidales bacterium]|jgi:ABC-2 type transport system ATP-binding protein|nr:ABC transporter ATP-binding protein [Bacteroidales bacterium]
MNILIENLVKTFGTKTALNIQELKINSGELVGIVGNNGAGKTTLFRLMLNLINGDSGSVRIDGEEVSKEDNWKERCGAFIDSGFLIEFLTPEEYFAFIAKLYNIGKVDLEERLASYSKLMSEEVLGQKKYIRDFSAGNKQKIGIIGALLSRPDLLILDEPFNFLDPSSQLLMTTILSNYCKETGATVLISSHNLNHVTHICPRILLLSKGELLRDFDNSDQKAEVELENYFAEA